MHMYVFMCIYIYELHIFLDFNIPKSTASAMTPFFSPCQVPHTRRLLLTSRGVRQFEQLGRLKMGLKMEHTPKMAI